MRQLRKINIEKTSMIPRGTGCDIDIIRQYENCAECADRVGDAYGPAEIADNSFLAAPRYGKLDINFFFESAR